jgi:tetratricopeptide (TPR) repeat protein
VDQEVPLSLWAHWDLGSAALGAGHVDDALAHLQALIERAERLPPDPEINYFIVEALVQSACLVGHLEGPQAMLAILFQVVNRFDDDDHLELRPALGKARVTAGLTLFELARYEEAGELLQGELDESLGLPVLELAQAEWVRAFCHLQLGDPVAAIDDCERARSRSLPPQYESRQLAATILDHEAEAFGKLAGLREGLSEGEIIDLLGAGADRIEQIRGIADDLTARLSTETDAAIKELLTDALWKIIGPAAVTEDYELMLHISQTQAGLEATERRPNLPAEVEMLRIIALVGLDREHKGRQALEDLLAKTERDGGDDDTLAMLRDTLTQMRELTDE